MIGFYREGWSAIPAVDRDIHREAAPLPGERRASQNTPVQNGNVAISNRAYREPPKPKVMNFRRTTQVLVPYTYRHVSY